MKKTIGKIIIFILWAVIFIMDIVMISDAYRFNDNEEWLRVWTLISLYGSFTAMYLMFLFNVPSYAKKCFDSYIDKRIENHVKEG